MILIKEGAEGTDLDELRYRKRGWGGFVRSEF